MPCIQLRKDSSGKLTFVEAESDTDSSAGLSRRESCTELSSPIRLALAEKNEKELLWELISDIFNDLDVDIVCFKILCNVSALVNADRLVRRTLHDWLV